MTLLRINQGALWLCGLISACAMVAVLAGCERHADHADAPPVQSEEPSGSHADHDDHDHATGDGHDHDHDAEGGHGDDADAHVECDGHDHGSGSTVDQTAASQSANGEAFRVVAIPPSVRTNLGITFVKAERRPVHSTVRLPGQFELRPEARREYHVMLAGRVNLEVEQFQTVKPGDVLFRLDSPDWRRVQSSLAEAFKACYCCLPELDAAKATQRENDGQIELLTRRVENLAGADTRSADIEAELAGLRLKTERLGAEVRAKEADSVSAKLAYDVLLNEAQSLTGVPRAWLEEAIPGTEDEVLEVPQWTTVNEIVVRAEAAGVVSRLGVTEQGWAGTGDLVLETVEPGMLRFHADALQTDMGNIHDGMAATIVPPPGGTIHLQDTMSGTITVGFQAHPDERTVSVYLVPDELPRWAKAGVTAYLEVQTKGNGNSVWAIPEAAVVRDGLEKVFFRRDPSDPDRVTRVVAELGTSDGRWIEVMHGVSDRDEIVLGGVYPLVLATSESGEIQQGGHFHGDGMFHQGEDH